MVTESHDLTKEEWREYDFLGEDYRIYNPVKLWITTHSHRVLDESGVVHWIPFNKENDIFRWKPRDVSNPIQF